jgi:hypothetical protein
MDELEKLHQDYEKNRNEIRTKLECIYANTSSKTHKLSEVERDWLLQAINFINEKEI